MDAEFGIELEGMELEGSEPQEQGSPQRLWVPNNVTYSYTVKRHLQQNVFEGSSKKIVPSGDLVPYRSHNRKLSILRFEDKKEYEKYSNQANNSWFSYSPDLLAEDKGVVHTIGRDVGEPLLKWMSRKGLEIWEYECNNVGEPKSTIRAGKDWRKVGRWLGAAVSDVHSRGEYIGNLLRSTYVNEKAQRVCFVRGEQVESCARGIKKDLEELAEFVKLMEEKRPPLTNKRSSDVLMFWNLYNDIQNLSEDLNPLKEFSYILTHIPLYWDFEQRRSFCDTYYNLRQHQIRHFDNCVSFEGDTYIDHGWRSKVESSNDIHLKAVVTYFDEGGRVYDKKYNLMEFHRNCLEHYNKKDRTLEDIDRALVKMFPDAVPKSYNEFVRSAAFRLDQKIDALKNGIPGLNYVDLIKKGQL